jgi:Ca2+-binding RTX toxin-like protein
MPDPRNYRNRGNGTITRKAAVATFSGHRGNDTISGGEGSDHVYLKEGAGGEVVGRSVDLAGVTNDTRDTGTNRETRQALYAKKLRELSTIAATRQTARPTTKGDLSLPGGKLRGRAERAKSASRLRASTMTTARDLTRS